MHATGIEPDKKRFSFILRVQHELLGQWNYLAGVKVLHSFLSERTGILDRLLADTPETRMYRSVVDVGSTGVDHAAGTKFILVSLETA